MENNPVHELRTKHGLTATQLAALAGCRVAAVWEAERGDVPVPHRRILAALARLGEYPEAVVKQYTAWRAQLAEAVASGRGKNNGAAPPRDPATR